MKKNNLLVLVSCVLFVGCSGTSPDLGVSNGELTPCPPTPNCVNSQGADENHKILPFPYDGTEQEAKERLLEVLKLEARAKVITANESYVRAEFTSSLFRFVDDVEFYISKTPTGATIIDVRSASRLGSSDLGANRKRIERLRSEFILSH
ncbi:MAG: hypothetical protein ACI8ZB_002511 [Desulforhopalus sp.]|jgi:uncharacterized protein (DUF1499 family)